MIRAYSDNAEVLRLADTAGCGMSLRAAGTKPHQTSIVAGTQVFIAHGAGEGYSAVSVDDMRDMPLLLLKLAPIIGPVQSARIEAHDTHCPRTETRH